MSLRYTRLTGSGLIACRGPDAAPFLHAQLTSDVTGLGVGSQYSGYCTPKGRLLATFLVWRTPEEILLQCPVDLVQDLRARLAKYVLRSKVSLTDATATYDMVGMHAPLGFAPLDGFLGAAPERLHELRVAHSTVITRLPGARLLALLPVERAAGLLEALARSGAPMRETEWLRSDIEQGIPTITRETQDRFVPQMLNLELIGGVSFDKGCYPGQEIVARTRYLGRIKQRTYRVRLRTQDGTPSPGDALYSARFGPEQASGAVLNAVPSSADTYEALAVIQTSSAASETIHWKSPGGPVLEMLPLPYAVPE